MHDSASTTTTETPPRDSLAGRAVRRLTGVVLVLAVAGPAGAGSIAPGIHADSISPNAALELNVGYRSGTDKILYSGLFDSGADNSLEFRMLSATQNTVSVDQDLGVVDSGQIFGLGDWCFSSGYGVMPYIKDFNVHALKYDLVTGNVFTVRLDDSLGAQYTNSDCFALDGGSTLVIGANNFDAKGLDYFVSLDDGLNWQLEVQYRPTAGQIIDGFAGGFLDSHGTFDGSHIGSIYQLSGGTVESVALQLDGTVVGTREIADGGSFIGNGSLKETDSYGFWEYCFGIANLGGTLSVAFIDTTTGNVHFGPFFDNQPGANALFGFEGVDLSGRALNATVADVFLTSQHLYLSRFDAATHQFSNSRTAIDYPLAGNGGPVDGFWSGDKERLFLFGVGLSFRGAAGGSTVAVIVDPETIRTAPVEGGLGSVPVSVLGHGAWLVLLSLLIAVAGIGLLYRRAGT